MLEYTRLWRCSILINIISSEAALTITVDTRGGLVAVNDMCNKNVFLSTQKWNQIHLLKRIDGFGLTWFKPLFDNWARLEEVTNLGCQDRQDRIKHITILLAQVPNF